MDNETIYAAMDLLRGLKDADLPQETRQYADALQLAINNERFPHYSVWVGSLPKVSEILHWYFQHKKLTGLAVVSTNGMKGVVVAYSRAERLNSIDMIRVEYEGDTECEPKSVFDAYSARRLNCNGMRYETRGKDNYVTGHVEPHYSDIAFVVDESGYKLPFDTNDRTEGLHRTLYTSLGEKI